MFSNQTFQGQVVVTKAIKPNRRGQVFFRGSWWLARCEQDLTLQPEQWVRMIALEMETITLLVQPERERWEQKL